MKPFILGTSSTVALAAALGLAAASSASAATLGSFDASGLIIDAASPFTDTFTVAAGTATSIDFDIDISTFGASWGSEVEISVVAPDASTFSVDGSDFGFTSSGGTFGNTLSLAISEAAAGVWSITFGDSFDDGGNDYQFNAGSSVTISGDPLVSAVPLPAALPLSLLGIGALAGFGRTRRRSKA